MYFSRPLTAKSLQISNGGLDKEEVIRIEGVGIDDSKEEIVDPEAANVGHSKRPMILTHSVMVGLTLILLIVIEGLVVSKVSTQEQM
jgi:hypothetical protein